MESHNLEIRQKAKAIFISSVTAQRTEEQRLKKAILMRVGQGAVVQFPSRKSYKCQGSLKPAGGAAEREAAPAEGPIGWEQRDRMGCYKQAMLLKDQKGFSTNGENAVQVKISEQLKGRGYFMKMNCPRREWWCENTGCPSDTQQSKPDKCESQGKKKKS